MAHLTRRQFISAATGHAVAANGLAIPARGLDINPRSTWAEDRPPKGPLHGEDVRFLIVHHSASWNGHTGTDTPRILRSFYDFHTSPERGWNDIAYNFLIDADGGIWEGRAGSLDGAVAGDATGGNQGSSQLVCIIGDYNVAQPTQASLSALVSVLAWLADRHGISTAPGAQVTFTSRGSNRHPEGAAVTTPTITGHRTMSQTSCPGANLDSYVAGGLSADVEAVRAGSVSTTTAPPTTSTTTVPATTTTTTPPSSTTTVAATTIPPTSTSPAATTPVQQAAEPEVPLPSGVLAAAGFFTVTAAGLLVWRHRRMSDR